jgi:hypothetical protein
MPLDFQPFNHSMKEITMKNIFLGLAVVLCGAAVCSAQTTFYFPHFVDGSQNPAGFTGWVSAMAITNPAAPGTPAASGSITLTGDNGSPLNLQLIDENGNPTPNTFQLAGGQTKFFNSPQAHANGILSLSSGYVTVTSSLPVVGGLVFLELNQNGAFAVAGVPAATALMKQGSIAVVSTSGDNPNNQGNTGIAVANPGTGPATITFQLVDKSGNQIVPQVQRIVAAGNHTAFFVGGAGQLFPNAPANVNGTLRMTSDQPIASLALLFQGTAFGTIPIYPLQ